MSHPRQGVGVIKIACLISFPFPSCYLGNPVDGGIFVQSLLGWVTAVSEFVAIE
ncbi:MAG: hypothetical protein NZ772_11780 [Cyanobacteria bacterium]|nr:hypothetical protein [Cyanobacteriota bacterium]MDW8202094.1 hypothetical protein [Cyanobacteriota bacterium SKYGB_h_bin112]